MTAAPQFIDLEQHRFRHRLWAFWLLGLLCGCGAALVLGVCIRPEWANVCSPWPCIERLWMEAFCVATALWGLPRRVLPVAAFLHAAAFGYTAQGVCTCFGSAGWLVWPLMLSPRLLFFPLLFCLAYRPGLGACLLCAASAAVIGFADFRLVMPFTAFLIE